MTASADLHPKFIWPREHGSWGMLLFPLVSAAVLTKQWSWLQLAVLAASMGLFLVREPLAILLRQRYVWKSLRPETESAKYSLKILMPITLIAGGVLLAELPFAWMASLAALGAVLMGLYLYGMLNNLQRSTWLQLAGAFGLTAACAPAYLAGGLEPDEPLAWLAMLHAVHSTGGVLTVHARLEALQSLKAPEPKTVSRRSAALWQVVQGACAAAAWTWGNAWLGASLMLALAVHVVDLARFGDPAYLKTKLRTVGFRELGLSAALSVLILIGLW